MEAKKSFREFTKLALQLCAAIVGAGLAKTAAVACGVEPTPSDWVSLYQAAGLAGGIAGAWWAGRALGRADSRGETAPEQENGSRVVTKKPGV